MDLNEMINENKGNLWFADMSNDEYYTLENNYNTARQAKNTENESIKILVNFMKPATGTFYMEEYIEIPSYGTVVHGVNLTPNEIQNNTEVTYKRRDKLKDVLRETEPFNHFIAFSDDVEIGFPLMEFAQK